MIAYWQNIMKFGTKLENKTKKTLNIIFHSIPVHDEKYIKTKVKEFNGVVNTNFWHEEIPKEGAHYTCID